MFSGSYILCYIGFIGLCPFGVCIYIQILIYLCAEFSKENNNCFLFIKKKTLVISGNDLCIHKLNYRGKSSSNYGAWLKVFIIINTLDPIISFSNYSRKKSNTFFPNPTFPSLLNLLYYVRTIHGGIQFEGEKSISSFSKNITINHMKQSGLNTRVTGDIYFPLFGQL